MVRFEPAQTSGMLAEDAETSYHPEKGTSRLIDMNQFQTRCPVCGRPADRGNSIHGEAKQFECPKCGRFQLTGTASAVLPGRIDDAGLMGVARMSYALHQMQRYEEWPLINSEQLGALINAKLPSVDDQLANLVRWMMEEVEDDFLSPIETPDYERLAAIIGARDGERVYEIVNHAVEEGLIKWVPDTCFALTVKGSRSMKQLMTDDLTLVNAEGEVMKPGIKGRITSGTLITFDSTLPITRGDRFLRRLPSGLEEEFIVEDPGFQAALPGMEAHFQAKIRRSDTPAQSLQTIVNNIQGANARVNINSTDNSSNVVNQDNRTQIYADLRERVVEIDADPQAIENIRTSINEMEAAHGTPRFKKKYLGFMSAAADHMGVFGPLMAALAGFL
jgi:predicted RNA-binding Zn-ribbon protein involved in translation (DUF1610 family)